MTGTSVTQDEAIAFHEAAAAAAGTAAIRQLFESVGAIKATAMLEQLTQGLSLSLARKVKDAKDYRLLPGKEGGRCTWDEFCQEYLGATSRHIDELLMTERQLGAGFCAAADRMGLRRADVRLLLSAPDSIQGDVREVVENSEGVAEDKLRAAIDHLVTQIADQAAVVEEREKTIEAKVEEIARRKRAEAKLEDRIRAREKEMRELRAEWSPSEEETAAGENITNENLQVRACLRRICVQIEALPDCKAIQTLGKGVRDDLVTYAEELSDVLLGVVNKAAKGKAS